MDILLRLWSQIMNHHIIKLCPTAIIEPFISTQRRIIQNKGLYLLWWNINDLWIFWWVKYPHFMSSCGNAMSWLLASVPYIVLYMKRDVNGWPVSLYTLRIDGIAHFAWLCEEHNCFFAGKLSYIPCIKISTCTFIYLGGIKNLYF